MLNRNLLFLVCIGGFSIQTSWGKERTPDGRAEARQATMTVAASNGKQDDDQLFLMENVGQVRDQYGAVRKDIHFKLNGGEGFSVFISAGTIYYQWTQPAAKDKQGKQQVTTYRMEMQLLGANKNAEVRKGDALKYIEQYGLGAGNATQALDRVCYKNIYPNIDWELYVKDGKLEYDFVVHEGAKVSDIRLRYNGATRTEKKADGSMVAYTPMGYVTARAPYSYSKRSSKAGNIPVRSAYTLHDNTIAFAIGKYKGTLVIDPVLQWGTYYGGSATEDGYGVATDAAGNVYMTGYTSSATNIATTGAFQSLFVGGPFSATDAYLVKLDSTGVRQWATYYGYTGTDNGTCITTDFLGNVYIAGNTTSTTALGTTGGFQPLIGGTTDAFLAKFAPDGNLIWATYYGGASPAGTVNADYAYGLKCDDSGNVYMAGQTNSTNNITTPGSYQQALAGNADAYVVKFDSAGMRQWGTYLGGPGFDQARALTLDAAGNVYVAGGTQSTSGIASAGAAQAAPGGASDGFLVKLNNDGMYQWGTYFGGTDYDGVLGVTCDDDQYVYIVGSAGAASTGLATSGSHQSIAGGNGDAILAKYDSTGTKMWATYYGGNGIEQGNAVRYDEFGNIYLLGSTKSIAGIATPGTFQDTISNNGANYEAYLAKFGKDGTRIWGTYYGGKGDDYGKALAMHAASGAVYFSGQTKSPNHIVTPGCHQDTMGNINSTDAMLIKFYECPTISKLGLSVVNGPDSLCPQSAVVYSVNPIPGVTAYEWILPNGWTGTSDSSSIATVAGVSGGSIQVRAFNTCDSTSFQVRNIYVHPFFPPTITVDSLILGTATPYASYQWFLDGQPITGATGSTYFVTLNGDYQVAVVSPEGCSDTSEIYVVNNAGGGTSIGNPAAWKEQIRVYPIPASDRIHIAAPLKVDITLTSIEGKILNIYKNARSIPVTHLAPGTYLLRITDTAGTLLKVEKVVKK